MVRISGGYRVLVIISMIWLVMALIETKPWPQYGNIMRAYYMNWDGFLGVGILPLLLLWGIIWIAKGFKKKGCQEKNT